MTIPVTAFTAVADIWFQDTLLNTALGTSPNAYKKRNPSDRLVFQTSNASVVIQGLVYDIPQNLSAYVDGVYYASVAFTGSFTNQLQTLTLPGGLHTVELEEEGVAITGIGSAGCNIQIIPYAAPALRVISYGDSIEVGYNVTGRFGLGWWQLNRRAEPALALLNDSYAGACFWDDNRDGSHQDAWVASLAPAIDGTTKTVLIIDRMTNDYGTAGTWSAANYGAGLLATLTKLHAAYPSLQVYLKTAILRGTGTFPPEGATNTFGDTLAQYRTSGAAAMASANSTLGTSFGVFDGTAMGLLSLTSDGLHPNNAGHAALSAWAVANWFPALIPATPPVTPPLTPVPVTRAGDTLVISPLSVQKDAGYAMRAESVHGGYVAIASGSGPPDTARLPLVMRREGALAYTPADKRFWQLQGGVADINWVSAALGGLDAGQVTAGGIGVVAGGISVVVSRALVGATGPAGAAGLDAGAVTAGGAVVVAHGVTVTVNLRGPVGPAGATGATGAAGAPGLDGNQITAGGVVVVAGGIPVVVSFVRSVFGRTGAVLAVAGDYAASKVTNDSLTVAGAFVSNALDALKSAYTALVTGVSSVFGRAGAIAAVAGDYDSSKITNLSPISGPYVTDALSQLQLEFPNGQYTVSASGSLSLSCVGQLGLVTGLGVTITIPTQATAHFVVNSKCTLFTTTGTIANIVGASGVVVHYNPAVVPGTGDCRFELRLIAANEWVVTTSPLTPTTHGLINTSGVTGTLAADALDTLNAHSFTGDITVPLNQITALSSGVPWSFNPSISLWYTNTSGGLFFCPLPTLPLGVTIDTLRVWIAPASGHSSLPTQMPVLTLAYNDLSGNVTAVASTTDPSANVSAYETPHVIVCSFTAIGPATGRNLYFLLVAENGSNVVGGTRVTFADVHVVP